MIHYTQQIEAVREYLSGQMSIESLIRAARPISENLPDYLDYANFQDELEYLSIDSSVNTKILHQVAKELLSFLESWQPEELVSLAGGTTPAVEISAAQPNSFSAFNAEFVVLKDHIAEIYLDLRGLPLVIPVYRHTLPTEFTMELLPLLTFWSENEIKFSNDFSEDVPLSPTGFSKQLILLYDEFGKYDGTPLLMVEENRS